MGKTKNNTSGAKAEAQVMETSKADKKPITIFQFDLAFSEIVALVIWALRPLKYIVIDQEHNIISVFAQSINNGELLDICITLLCASFYILFKVKNKNIHVELAFIGAFLLLIIGLFLYALSVVAETTSTINSGYCFSSLFIFLATSVLCVDISVKEDYT